MSNHTILQITTCIFGLTGIILMYYSIALSWLNSAQLDRILEFKTEGKSYHGLRPQYLIQSLHIAVICVEILFFLGLSLLLFLSGWDWIKIIWFITIGVGAKLTACLFLPLAFPLSTRIKLTAYENRSLVLLGYCFYPIGFIIRFLSKGIVLRLNPKSDEERVSDAEEAIKSIIDAGEEVGIFKDDDSEMLQSIVEFSETIVREVMTPRIDMKCIEISNSLEEFIDIVINTGYSKIPVFNDRIDDIEGILYVKDVLQYWGEKDNNTILSKSVRPAYFIPETKKVRDLLREFQREKIHMALVVDEYGGIAGLVTIEDLLEEIVGEIQDEYDIEEKMIQDVCEDKWTVDAKIDLDDLEEKLDVKFPRDNFETLGGFMFDRLGRIPSMGEVISYQNLDIEVQEVDDRRIVKVVVYRRTEQKGEFTRKNE